MRESEAGFTLIELVVVIAIVAITVAASIWLFGSHPGALRASVDGFDQRYAEARSLAATTGNGATIVFAPRATGPGFVMSVYAGRPTAANAVTRTNTMQLISDADISELALGSPPFAIFLSSAGRASGSAHYPSIDTQGNATFPVIAKQPACPAAGGFTLMFTSVTLSSSVTLSLSKGVSDSRKLSCEGVMAFGTAVPQPSMSPEQLRIDTPSMLAHWTTDAGPLHFKVGEFGYTHWFAAADANPGCAEFNTPYPYRTASPTEMSAAPSPPNAPYTWAVQEAGHPPDQPPGAFVMSPVSGIGGVCTARIVDDNGQEVDSAIRVMGDLTAQGLLQTNPRHYTLPDFASPTDSTQTVVMTKTFDGEQLALQFGGACGGIVAVSQIAHFEGPSNASTPATTGTIRIAPVAAGSCVLEVTEQYGEPHDVISINVKSPLAMETWPIGVQYGLNGSDLLSPGPCRAIAYKDAVMTQADANDSTFASIGASTDSRGCYNGALVAYEPGGAPSQFTVQNNNCNNSIRTLQWSPQPSVSSALSIASGAVAVQSCQITLQDSNGSGKGTWGNGLVNAAILDNDCSSSPCIVGPDYESSTDCSMDPTTGGILGSWETTIASFAVGAGLGTLTSDGTNWLFSRTAYGAVTILLDDQREHDMLAGSPSTHDMHCVKQAPTSTKTYVSF